METDRDLLQARKKMVVAAMSREAGQQRKSAVADKFFDAFLREHSVGSRGWERATDEDVLQ